MMYNFPSLKQQLFVDGRQWFGAHDSKHVGMCNHV